MPSLEENGPVSSQNSYTEEVKVTTSFLVWGSTHDLGSWFQQLPDLIRNGKWDDAFRGYRRMLDGLDLWVADQLRKTGKGTAEEARGNAHQYHSQLRTGLEQIADKHATRLPAIFHPDAKTVEKEKAAGRPAADTIPVNVYFWKDDKDGRFHLYDLTTLSQPHEQIVDGPPTAAMMNTFFEEVARYPEGEVRYTLPGGAGGVAPTTGKIKWYEWIGYAGLAIAGAGLALVTLGASMPATICFAAGAIAGGISAGGHLVDTERLGTATSATVVLDAAQIIASFTSFGALSISIKAGGAAAALTGNRWFVPLIGTTAAADAVQLVALTEVTLTELKKIENGAGTQEDKNRAMTVLISQFLVVGGLTALSVRGARSAHALSGLPLEVIDENGVKVLRVVGEGTRASVGEPEAVPGEQRKTPDHVGADPADHSGRRAPSADNHQPKNQAHADPSGPPAGSHDAEHWLSNLERSLSSDEKAKLAKMKSGKTPQQIRDMLGGDMDAAHERVRAEVRAEQARAAATAQSKERVADLRKQITDRGLMNDPEVRAIVEGTTPKNRKERIQMLRDRLVAKLLRADAQQAHPGAEVIEGIKIYEKLPEPSRREWHAKNPGKDTGGLTERDDGLYMQRGEIDIMIIERQKIGKAKVIAREEIKTGTRDTSAAARGQLDEQSGLLRDAAAGKKAIRLEVGGRNVTDEIDLGSDASANKSTRGPAGKGYDVSLGISATDLEALSKSLLTNGVAAEKGSP